MINTEENKITVNEILGIKTFPSLKNNCFFEYESKFEKCLMTLCEADRTIDKYEPFIFRMKNKTTGEEDKYPALITESDEKITYIISGDQLVGNQELGEDIRKRLQKFHSLPVFVMLGSTTDLETDFISINVGFLYEFALLPSDHKAFAKVQEIVGFVGEVSIGQLKKKVGNEMAIYQLMFHQALRADLENELISDDTIVNASPIINSIIKNLQK